MKKIIYLLLLMFFYCCSRGEKNFFIQIDTEGKVKNKISGDILVGKVKKGEVLSVVDVEEEGLYIVRCNISIDALGGRITVKKNNVLRVLMLNQDLELINDGDTCKGRFVNTGLEVLNDSSTQIIQDGLKSMHDFWK